MLGKQRRFERERWAAQPFWQLLENGVDLIDEWLVRSAANCVAVYLSKLFDIVLKLK